MSQICAFFWEIQGKGSVYTWIKFRSQRDKWLKAYVLFKYERIWIFSFNAFETSWHMLQRCRKHFPSKFILRAPSLRLQVKVKNENVAFAMKCIRKKHIVDTKQQEHVYSEKRILEELCSPFIVKYVSSWPPERSLLGSSLACYLQQVGGGRGGPALPWAPRSQRPSMEC